MFQAEEVLKDFHLLRVKPGAAVALTAILPVLVLKPVAAVAIKAAVTAAEIATANPVVIVVILALCPAG